MIRFWCACGQEVFLENAQCLACLGTLAFNPESMTVLSLPSADAASLPGAAPHLCANYSQGICNWLVNAEDHQDYCLSCRLNEMVPDPSVAGNLALWARVEIAKRRLLHGLLSLGLPFTRQAVALPSLPDTAPAMRFALLADTPTEHVTTGHEDGLITLALAEADDVQRNRIRERLGEPYRTLLGHLRHECGHYYWTTLIEGTDWQAAFRELFGDESLDYDDAMARHYQHGPPPAWETVFISAYASMHPHEDWAESWAHYLHIVDTLETARAYGLSVADANLPCVSTDGDDFAAIAASWISATVAVNALNRSMGQPDIYPFSLPGAAIAKLQFVHDVVRANQAAHVLPNNEELVSATS